MNKYLVILLSLLFPCMLLAQNKGIRAVDNKGTIIYIDPSKWFKVGDNLFNKNTDGNVAIGVDTLNIPPLFNSRLYIYNNNSTTIPVLKLDKPFAGALTDSVLTWNPSDFSVRKIPISTLSPNDWHLLGNAGTDPATNFIGTTDDQPLIFKINNQQSGALTSVFSGANTSFGHYSLQNPNVAGGGINNSAFGAGALILTSTGANNTAMGVTALQNNTTGGNNTAVGMNSMTNSITGSDNVAMGMSALFGNAAGSGNTAIGASAGYNVVGNYNTLIGLKSGLSIRSGTNNTVIGGSSTGDITVSADNASNELNIGNALYGTGINNAAGANTGKIGINTNDPQAQLDVNGQVRVRTLPAGVVATDKIVTADTDGNLRTLLPADLVPATTVSNTSSVNTLTTTVNDVTGTGVNIINSNTLTATDGNLVSRVNGVETTPAVPVLISADNGLTVTNGNVQLGGTLTKTPTTTIATDATHTLAISGLQTVVAPTTDNLVTADASGVLHQRTVADAVGSVGWLITGNTGTNPANNFLGTIDDKNLIFKVNNVKAGIISPPSTFNNTALGYQALQSIVTTTSQNTSTVDNTAIGSGALSSLAIIGNGNNTAVGVNALNKTVGSVGNTALGSLALGNYIGNNAGNTSARNTAVGYLAMVGSSTNVNNNIGSNNTALGVSAMGNSFTNISGSYNVALGANALKISAAGSYNTAVGANAGSAVTGNNNIMIGGSLGNEINPSAAGNSNELNIGNTLFGTGVNGTAGNTTGRIGINTNAPIAPLDARGSVRTGSPDIAATIGTNSFAGGSNSVASGANSFAYGNVATASGSNTAAFGTSTASGNLSFAGGNGNKALANYSTAFGQTNTINSTATVSFATGYNNTVNASNSAAFGSTNTINNTNGGQNAVAMGTLNEISNNGTVAMGRENKTNSIYSVVMGYKNTLDEFSDYSVAAGNANAITYSKQAFTAGSSNTIGSSVTSNGDYSAVFGNTNKIGNIAQSLASFSAGASNTVNGNYSTALGQYNQIGNVTAANNANIIGSYGRINAYNGSLILADVSLGTYVETTASNQFTSMFNGGYRLLTNRIDLTKGMTMDAAGNATFSGGVTATGYSPSDIRLKKDIQNLKGVLDNIKQLRGVTYYWKDASKGSDLQLGMIAQELEKVYPELVITNKDTGLKAVNYAQFTGVLLEGIKEQQTQIDDLNAEVDALKKQIQEIKDLLKK